MRDFDPAHNRVKETNFFAVIDASGAAFAHLVK